MLKSRLPEKGSLRYVREHPRSLDEVVGSASSSISLMMSPSDPKSPSGLGDSKMPPLPLQPSSVLLKVKLGAVSVGVTGINWLHRPTEETGFKRTGQGLWMAGWDCASGDGMGYASGKSSSMAREAAVEDDLVWLDRLEYPVPGLSELAGVFL